jgi:hypothetical protein
MRKNMSDKLIDITVEIDQHGFANLTKLTVLKNGLRYLVDCCRLRYLLQIVRQDREQKQPRKKRSFLAKRVLYLAMLIFLLPIFRAIQQQNCMHVFGHSKMSIGMWHGELCASFITTTFI